MSLKRNAGGCGSFTRGSTLIDARSTDATHGLLNHWGFHYNLTYRQSFRWKKTKTRKTDGTVQNRACPNNPSIVNYCVQLIITLHTCTVIKTFNVFTWKLPHLLLLGQNCDYPHPLPFIKFELFILGSEKSFLHKVTLLAFVEILFTHIFSQSEINLNQIRPLGQTTEGLLSISSWLANLMSLMTGY